MQAMLFFLGVRALLTVKQKQTKEKLKLKDKIMGKRGKRKNKWQRLNADEYELELMRNEPSKKNEKKPFENIKLPPPRDAQSKPDEV